MKPICKICQKEMVLDTALDSITLDLFDLFWCNLCQSPVIDTMYKEVYKKIYTEDGTIIESKLICSVALIDKYYIIWNGYNVDFDYSKDETLIFKNITGTVAHSVFLFPITVHDPIVRLPFALELPFHDLAAVLKKLGTITTFS